MLPHAPCLLGRTVVRSEVAIMKRASQLNAPQAMGTYAHFGDDRGGTWG